VAHPTPSTVALVAGVDGCRSGWAVVTVSADPTAGGAHVEVVDSIEEVVDRLRRGDLAAAAVDMPIGLAPVGPRPCDDEARRRLGARRATVFPTPPRPILDSPTHAEAVRRGRALDGRGISIQAFNLLPRIAELDAAVSPDLCDRIVEAHPESAFAAMAGAPLASSKRSPEGRDERRALLDRHLGPAAGALPARLRGAAVDDLLDAAANAWTARRWLAGTAEVLGDGGTDERGLPMRIVT
jgi:predicted RNase H-like nuclease